MSLPAKRTVWGARQSRGTGVPLPPAPNFNSELMVEEGASAGSFSWVWQKGPGAWQHARCRGAQWSREARPMASDYGQCRRSCEEGGLGNMRRVWWRLTAPFLGRVGGGELGLPTGRGLHP